VIAAGAAINPKILYKSVYHFMVIFENADQPAMVWHRGHSSPE